MDHQVIQMLMQLAVGTISRVLAAELTALLEKMRSKKQPPKKIS